MTKESPTSIGIVQLLMHQYGGCKNFRHAERHWKRLGQSKKFHMIRRVYLLPLQPDGSVALTQDAFDFVVKNRLPHIAPPERPVAPMEINGLDMV